jgi:tetratricopeptide (TPR) repeat protein
MDEFKNKGNAAFKAGKFQEAIEWYTKALGTISATDEAAAALLSNRAASFSSLGKHQEALADAEACIVAKPAWVKGPFRKGVALEALGKYTEAEKALEQALNCERDNADIQERLNKIRTVIREKTQKQTPAMCKTAEEAKNIGNSFFKEGKYDMALAYYTRALDMTPDSDPNKVNYYNNRAACNNQTHNYPQIISDCTSALALDPANLKAKLRRGYAYKGLEKWKLALEDFTAVNMAQPSPNVSQEISRCKQYIS